MNALQEHPSEATTLLAAAVRGVRGRVEIRDSGGQVAIDDQSANTWIVPTSDALAVNKLAQALTATRSLTEADQFARDICGHSELSYEKRKADAAHLDRPQHLSDDDFTV